ncbi:hypothetical protein RGUI_0087 (plasmid) [Rhodovulum sp. P5]|uniref:hypothetical protein n=1 Tax=Rhodovulum sp. P5 TaxID=1564506 RepID=UPI0009C2C65B|nr:hypothetical protein [Rhodovulum sp. P5]ARE42445.1 hypothetical protein RGUI_0087 [Rhodovulum sp. P5]
MLIATIPVRDLVEDPACPAHRDGAGFNTTIALGRLVVPKGLLAGLSADDFGNMLRAALEQRIAAIGMAVMRTGAQPSSRRKLSLETGAEM